MSFLLYTYIYTHVNTHLYEGVGPFCEIHTACLYDCIFRLRRIRTQQI